MGLFGALTASVAGLAVQGQAISVISDNLANTNTTGYKASRSVFDQLVTGSGVSGTAYNAGGVQATTQRDQAAQGSLTATSSTTDLAISGNGYFRVASDATPSSNTSYYYTRAGSFSENKAGYLTDPNGMYLQGWKTDSEGNIANLQNLSNISLGSVGVSAEETTNVKLAANLNSSATAETSLYDTSAGLSSSLDNVLGSTDANIYTTDVRAYDAQGNARDLNVVFSKRADNTWDYQTTTDGSNLQGGTAGTQTRVSSGTLTFNTDGTLQDVTTTDPTTGAATQGATVTADWSGGVNPSNITLNLGAYTGGTAVTAASSGLSFNSGVLSTAVQNSAMPVGTYTMKVTGVTGGVASLELDDSTGASVATTTMSTAAGNRTIVFNNSTNNTKVQMTVSSGFSPDPTPGTYPASLGTLTVGTIAASGSGGGTDGVVQYASDFNTSSITQDGFGSGLLSGVSIGSDGNVSGTFTNGETKVLYKVALGVFENQDGLEPVSGQLAESDRRQRCGADQGAGCRWHRVDRQRRAGRLDHRYCR